jgi:predicted XRE-type DNA-binding protein
MSKSVTSSGNVFRDIGFSPAEAENLRHRAELMLRLKRLISERGLTQIQAAGLFGVTQPRVSDIVRGKIHVFTIDALVEMLTRAGVPTRIVPDRRATRAEPFFEFADIEREYSASWGGQLTSARVPAILTDDSDDENREEPWVATYALCA